MAIPTLDVPLVAWSGNANTRLTASPTTYGTTATVAAAYATLHDGFVLAYNNLIAARAAGTRSAALTSLKDNSKLALLAFARPLYKQIQANTSVSDDAKIELGVVVPNPEPTPVPVPGFAPQLTVTKVNGRIVTISLRDPAQPDRARMPDGCKGALVMTFVGPVAPTDPRDFRMQGPTSRVDCDVLFEESVTPGTQVWITAVFFNEKMQMGLACPAVGTVINYGGSLPMAA